MKNQFTSNLMFLKKSFLRLFLFLLLMTVLGIALGRFCRLATDGFSIGRILYSLPKNTRWIPPSLKDEESLKLKNILSQNFFYLGCGGQTYVFVSEDGSYVLKFFKFHHLRPFIKIPSFFLTAKEKLKQDLVIQKKQKSLEAIFDSFVIAFDDLHEESQLIYHHLQETNHLQASLVFFDKIGSRHQLPADTVAFAIQKKGECIKSLFKKLHAQGDIEKAQRIIDQLIDFSIQRANKGIADHDFKFTTNLGVIDNKPAQIDLGSLVKDSNQLNPAISFQDLSHALKKFEKWLEKESPELRNYLETKHQQLLLTYDTSTPGDKKSL